MPFHICGVLGFWGYHFRYFFLILWMKYTLRSSVGFICAVGYCIRKCWHRSYRLMPVCYRRVLSSTIQEIS